MTTLRVDSRQFSATSAAFKVPHQHLGPTLGVTPLEFRQDVRHQKTRVPAISSGVICVIVRLAVSVEHRLVMDGQTDTRRQLIAALATVARVLAGGPLFPPEILAPSDLPPPEGSEFWHM